MDPENQLERRRLMEERQNRTNERLRITKEKHIQAGNPDTGDRYNRTRLILLCRTKIDSNLEEIIIELLNDGADINAVDIYDNSALCYAASKGSIQIVKELLNRGAVFNKNEIYILHTAAKHGRLEVVRELLLNDREHIDCKHNMSKMTCLMFAAKKGHIEVVKELIEFGANPHITTKLKGKTLTFLDFFNNEEDKKENTCTRG